MAIRVLPLLLSLLLLSHARPLRAHSGTLAIAVPLEGIVVDGDLSDWPDEMVVYPVSQPWYGDSPRDEEDYQGSFRIGYSQVEGALYLAVVVRDESAIDAPTEDRWSRDGCQVLVDRPHTDRDVWGYSLWGDQAGVFGQADADALTAAVERAGHIHQYEFRIDIGEDDEGRTPLQPDRSLGIDVIVRDQDGDGSFTAMDWAVGGLGDVLLARPGEGFGRITGRIVWGTGEGVTRTPLKVLSIDSPDLWATLRTDRQGYYAMELPSGTYQVQPAVGRGGQDEATVQVADGRTFEVRELAVPRPQGAAVRAGPGKRAQASGRRVAAGMGERQGAWRTLGVADGLPDPSVTDIVEDRDGNLWFTTNGNGVARYDGLEFVAYSRRDGLASDVFSAALEDRNGTMWFASGAPFGEHRGGVSRLSGEELVGYTTDDGLPSDEVMCLLEDRRGHLWMGTHEGAVRFDGERFTTFTSEDGLAADFVWDLLEDREGGLWFATSQGVSRFDGERFVSYTHEDGLRGQVLALAQDLSGDVWLGTYGGLSRFDGESLTHYTSADGLSDDWVMALDTDRDGALWVGTLGGLFRYDGHDFIRLTEADGLAQQSVMSILEDRRGDLWLGTGGWYPSGIAAGNGVSQYRQGEFVTYTTEDGLPSNGVMSLGEDRRGDLWFGTWSGIAHYDGAIVEPIDEPFGNFWAITEDAGGDVWFGSHSGGAQRYDGESFVPFGRERSATLGSVHSIAVDARGHLWFAGDEDLYRYDGVDLTAFGTEDGLLDGDTRCVVADGQGRVWVGTEQGVSRYDGHEFISFNAADGLPPGPISALLEDGDENLWFGSIIGGLGRYDGQTFTTFTTADGLSSNRIGHLMQDDAGHLWISTWGGGVNRFDGRVFQALLRRDGLPHNAVQESLQDRAGDIWLATEGGVVRYRPPQTPPSLRLLRVIADREHGVEQEIRLSGTQDYLAFEFRGSSFTTRTGQMAYVYRLQGHEAAWQVTRTERVTYRDLPEGDYVFEVQAVDRDLNYSDAATVRLVVTPAYGRWALYGSLGLSLIGLLTAGRYGVKRRRERDQARTELVAERRQRIEAQPHDIEDWTVDDFAGSSAAMQAVLSRIRELQQDDSRALITGEAGTGKELVARAIHAGSRRSGSAFVPVRCASLPKQLASLDQRTAALSILFGHTRGAFPGADEDHPGLVQQAHGGTLFFDEVGLLPLPLQAHLLRVLTQGTVRRTGAAESEGIDARVLAATSEDLAMQVEVGGFSRDLFEYVAVQQVAVPPLRERREDVMALAQQIVDRVSPALRLEPTPVSEEVVELLKGYDFPGNVRQLHRALEQALRASGGPIRPETVNLGG